MQGSNLPAPNAAPNAVTPFDNLALQIWTSLPHERRAEAAALVLGTGETERVSDAVNQVVEVEHVVIHRVELLDEKTGAIDEADRIVLLGANGESWAAVSSGVRRSLQVLGALYGLPPWTPALKLRVNQINTRNGRRYLTLTFYAEVVRG